MAPSVDPLDPGGSCGLPPSADAVRAQLERILGTPVVHLSPRRRALLRYLVEETLAGRGDLLKGFTVALAVFGRDESFDQQTDPVVRLEARRLRRDLDSYYVAAGRNDPVLITIPKGGYVPRFEWQRADPPREALPPGIPIPGPAAGANHPDVAAARSPGRPRAGLAAALAGVTIVPVAALWFWLDPALPPLDADAQGPGVIVLPFEALSSGEEDRFFASGLTQEIVTDLMRFDGLRLYSISASFQQDGRADPVELGHDLGVSYVVKGSVRSEGGSVRVSAQLFEAATGQVLWSEIYDRGLAPGDLLEVQAEVAGGIASVLGQAYGIVNTDATERLSTGTVPSMPSYACVLRAHDYRRSFGDDLYGPVRNCLEAAVERDPGYADAWAMLGWLHLDAGRFGIAPEGPDAAYALALDTASHASTIDPSNTLALKALGAIYHYTGRYDESVQAMYDALEINPYDPEAMAQLGWRLAVRGRFDEGIPYLKRAIERTISPPGWYFHLVAVDDYLKGDYRTMLADAERSAVDGSAMSQSFIAIAHGALGNGAEARATLDRLEATWPDFLRDPAAAYRVHHPTDSIIDALVAGLRTAGWKGNGVGPTF